MLKFCALAVTALLSAPVLAAPPVIYGEDNRLEVYEAPELHQKLAASAVAMIEKTKLTRTQEKPGLVQIAQSTFRQWLESQFDEEEKLNLDEKITFCPGERFTEQPNAALCSGFLVGPDLVVTAGHCVAVANFCENYSWVFDYQLDPVTLSAGVDVPEENVYECKRVISTALSPALGLDYGLIQLDRRVKGRTGLPLRSEGALTDDTNLVVIGNPSGLPLKVSGGARVRTNIHPNYFSAKLDTFQGNSGSAVINADTGVVEGILVRGEEDFEANTGLMCIEAKRCADGECRGEDVSRMTSIPEIAARDALLRLAEKGDERGVEKLLKNKFWIDVYGNDGVTALMAAARSNEIPMMELLLDNGADPKLTDAEGSTVLHHLATGLTKKSRRMLRTLLAAGADLEARNLSSETALLVAARSLNLTGVKLLIKAGADVTAMNAQNENALAPFLRAGNTRAVQDLVKLGVSAAEQNTSLEMN